MVETIPRRARSICIAMPGERPRGPASQDSGQTRLRLSDIQPDLHAFVGADDRPLLDQISVPAVDVTSRAVDVAALIRQSDAFGGVVVEGMLLHYLQLGNHPCLRVIGPGELVALRAAPRPGVIGAESLRGVPPTRIALLGSDFLLAARRLPRLLIGIHIGFGEQMERLATQLAICQLPRVEDRVLSMLWLLSDSWGRVTSSGVRLQMGLTHELVGALVGARRPTVTLALSLLTERGAVVPQDGGWLLKEHPPPPSPAAIAEPDMPRLPERGPSNWSVPVTPGWDPHRLVAELGVEVDDLRERHQRNVQLVSDRLRRSEANRVQARELLARIRTERELTRRRAPSS
jgi:hypothetical protein